MSHSNVQPANLNITYPPTTTFPDTSAGAYQPPVIINNPVPQGQYFTAEDLEKARQQEKEKLYGRLQKQEDTINTFQAQLEELKQDKAARDAEAKRLADEAEKARKAEEDSKLTAQQLIQQREAELKKEQEEFQKNMELKIATMQKEQEFLQLQSYIQRRVAEVVSRNEVIPELVEFIGGNTIDEVEASITKVKEKTDNIVKGAATLTAPSMTGGVSPTGGPSSLLDGISGPKQYSETDIRNMTMAEYAKWRQQQGLDQAGSGRGLFS